MAALRRTMAAGFRIEEAVTLERAQEEREALLLPLDEYFRACPRFTVQNETQEKRAYNGNAFTARGIADGECRVYDRAGNFLSLSRAEGGELHAIKNFF
jgi:tRNA pseudouridine55 synthase